MTTATQQGAAQKLTLGMEWSETDAAEELLQRFTKDADTPSGEEGEKKEKAPPAPETDNKAPAEKPEAEEKEEDGEQTKETDEEAEDDGEEKTYADEESTYVKIKVGEEEHEVPVSKLTRLYGQEASLTKKSMEVAELRKAADAEAQKNALATQALLNHAEARWKPYADLDFNLLATQVGREGGITHEEYAALRNNAQAAWEEKQFLSQNLDAYVQEVRTRETKALQEKAKEALKVLSGPADKGGIEGWSQKLYDDIRAYGISYGIPAEVINTTVDPLAIRLMHDAMMYSRMRDTKSEVKTVKVAKGPKKIVKTTNRSADTSTRSAGSPSSEANKALTRLKQTGSQDDAAEALLARWKSMDTDD
jgi:hypothetical protein